MFKQETRREIERTKQRLEEVVIERRQGGSDEKKKAKLIQKSAT